MAKRQPAGASDVPCAVEAGCKAGESWHRPGNHHAIVRGQVKRRRVISGKALSRTGGPVIPMPRLTYNCEWPWT